MMGTFHSFIKYPPILNEKMLFYRKFHSQVRVKCISSMLLFCCGFQVLKRSVRLKLSSHVSSFIKTSMDHIYYIYSKQEARGAVPLLL